MVCPGPARDGQWDGYWNPPGAGAALEMVPVPRSEKLVGWETGDFSPPSEMNGMYVSMCVYSLCSDEAANYS